MASLSSPKAQSTIISALIVLIISIIIVFAAFTFGLDILEEQQDETLSNYYRAKLLEIKRDIREVVHEGGNSSRSTQIDLREATLLINSSDGSPCDISNNPDSNGLMIHLDTGNPIIEGVTNQFILIDPLENNTKCTAEFAKNESGVLLLKSERLSSGNTLNTFFLWFRDLENVATGDSFRTTINAQSGRDRFSGGTFTITVKNVGTDTTGPIETKVNITVT